MALGVMMPVTSYNKRIECCFFSFVRERNKMQVSPSFQSLTVARHAVDESVDGVDAGGRRDFRLLRGLHLPLGQLLGQLAILPSLVSLSHSISNIMYGSMVHDYLT